MGFLLACWRRRATESSPSAEGGESAKLLCKISLMALKEHRNIPPDLSGIQHVTYCPTQLLIVVALHNLMFLFNCCFIKEKVVTIWKDFAM